MSHLDTYDLDMEVAFSAAVPPLPGQIHDRHGLVPPSTVSEPGGLEHELNYEGNDLADIEDSDRFLTHRNRRLSQNNQAGGR